MGLIRVVLTVSCGGSQTSGPSQTVASSAGASRSDAHPAEKPPAVRCPSQTSAAAIAGGGSCFEQAVLGVEAAEACGDELAAKGWVRDPAAETAIGGRTGTKVICYHVP
jgi:hypothetical protein